MKTKLRLCRYPANGFGEKANKYYLLDQFGHIFEIENEYFPSSGESTSTVTIYDRLYQAINMSDLLEYSLADFNITTW